MRTPPRREERAAGMWTICADSILLYVPRNSLLYWCANKTTSTGIYTIYLILLVGGAKLTAQPPGYPIRRAISSTFCWSNSVFPASPAENGCDMCRINARDTVNAISVLKFKSSSVMWLDIHFGNFDLLSCELYRLSAKTINP